MPSLGKFVQSKDGTQIWTHAAGDPTKPAIVFIPGFSCTALAFEKQFDDPKLLENLYLVSIRYPIHFVRSISHSLMRRSPFIRSVMIPAGRDRAVSLSRPTITTQRDTPMTLRLLLMNIDLQNLLFVDGALVPADFSAPLNDNSGPDL